MIEDKTTLKARFRNGAAVSAGDFDNLIDSFYNLAEVSSQVVSGANGAGISVTTLEADVVSAGSVSANYINCSSSANFNFLETQNLYRSTLADATAAGSVQSQALPLTKDFTRFIYVTANQAGAMLTKNPGISKVVFNDTNTNLNVYPTTGAQINALTANLPYVVSASVVITFYSVSGVSADIPVFYTG